MTDQEINEAVARKLGWYFCQSPAASSNQFHNPGQAYWVNREGSYYMSLPDFCRSISAAWHIVEWALSANYDVDIFSSPKYRGDEESFTCNIANATWQAEASTAPMAICLAFLKLP